MLPEILPDFVYSVNPSPEGLDLILEQVGATPCSAKHRPMIEIRDDDHRRAAFFRPRCKSWSCKPCAEQNAKFWAFRAAYGVEKLLESKSLYLHGNIGCSAVTESDIPKYSGLLGLEFVTLTSHEKLSPDRSIEVFGKAWDKLRRRISRQGDFDYLLVPEQHKSGRLHIHMLTTAKLPKRWWKDNARSCGLGHQVAAEPIRDPGKAAGYCLKYVTKSLECQAWPRGFRRVRTSAHWPAPPESPPFQGLFNRLLPPRVQLSDQVALLQSQGYSVALVG